MSEYLDQEHEHDYEIFNHKKINRKKIVDVCPSTGTGITQGEVDDYNAAAAAKRKNNGAIWEFLDSKEIDEIGSINVEANNVKK